MLVYRMLTGADSLTKESAVGAYKDGRFGRNIYCVRTPSYNPSVNTVRSLDRKEQAIYFFFYPQDAIRWGYFNFNCFFSDEFDKYHMPYLAEFEINSDLLAQTVALGLYGANNETNNPLKCLEFAILKSELDEVHKISEGKYDCMTGNVLEIYNKYRNDWSEILVQLNHGKKTYSTPIMRKILGEIQKMLRAKINTSYVNDEGDSFFEYPYSYPYEPEQALTLLKKLDH